MKIGIIADIHGEIAALHRALTLLERHAVDHIICAGDLIDRGPDGDAVVRLIRERNIPCVQGNHDQQAKIARSFFARHTELAGWMGALQPETVAFLQELPTELRFEWTGRSVYLTHANPWQDATRYIYPDSPFLTFFDVVAAAKADIVILGHTHTPMAISIIDTLVFNPGSVYANRGTKGQSCGILTLPAGAFALFDVATGQQIPLAIKSL